MHVHHYWPRTHHYMQYDANTHELHHTACNDVYLHVLKPSLPWHNWGEPLHKYSDSSDLASFPGFPASSFDHLRLIKNWTVGRPENVASCDHCGNWHWWYGVVGFVHCCKNSPTPIFSEGKSTSVGDTQWWVKSKMTVVVSYCCTDSPTPIFCETENKQVHFGWSSCELIPLPIFVKQTKPCNKRTEKKPRVKSTPIAVDFSGRFCN